MPSTRAGAAGRRTKGGVKTTRASVAKRRQQVSELYLEGHSMVAIGEQLKIVASTVWNDLQAARLEWRTQAVENIDKLIQRELSRIDYIEMEALKAWQRSIGPHIKTVEKSGTRPGVEGGGSFDETTEHTEELAGDPRFLDVMNKCVEQRRKILGLDAPSRSTISNPDGSPLLTGIRVIEVGKDKS